MVRIILNCLSLIDLVLTCGEKGLGQEFPAFSCIIIIQSDENDSFNHVENFCVFHEAILKYNC